MVTAVMKTDKKQSDKQAKSAAIGKAKFLAPDLAAYIGSTPATKYRGNPDIFGRLVEDHDLHRAIFAMIEQTEGKSPERIKLFRELNKEVQGHAAAEEQALWSTVLRNPKTTPDARHAIAEHHELDHMFADLAARDMDSSTWLKKFALLKEEYLHHIKEEEQEQFAAAEGILTATDLRYMRKVFNRRKKEEKSAAQIEKKIKLK
ncbi:MAG: hemerythrin domain-containing protein [Nitrosomonadales bacterium]|nr:hemerythrin domain-containing protein [Nitrosomonadales bacterium]